MKAKSRQSTRGFTLIEALASLVILAVLGSVASSILMTATDGYFASSTHGKMHVELSIAMDRAVREIRRIPMDSTAPAGSPNIDSTTSTTLEWQDSADEDCEITLTGDELLLTLDGGAPAVLLRDVDEFTITALDEDAASIALPASGAACDGIRQIELTMTISRSGESETLRTRVFLRSTMNTTP